MDAIERAKYLIIKAASEVDDHADYADTVAEAHALAAIAQAEALARIANATERRNELLSEYNEAARTAQDEHTAAMNAGIKKMLDAFYGPDEA